MKDQRIQYWNEKYYTYWHKRVNEANTRGSTDKSSLVKNDCLTSSDEIYLKTLKLLNIQKNSIVLEAGCGFGRSIQELSSVAERICAIDISETMIKIAKKNTIALSNINLLVSSIEATPFADCTFDQIICFAVFDSLYQEKSLIEMNRILKIGGRVLITGKNDTYMEDDTFAIEAEKKARLNKHPNYFTDISKLLNNLYLFGYSVDRERYYIRRGDFSKEKYTLNKPEKFYEYIIILKKNNKSTVKSSLRISNNFSKTYINHT